MPQEKTFLRENSFDKGIEIVTFLLIGGSVILLATYYSQLPEKLPIYFDWPAKHENGFATKNLLWAIPLICGILAYAIFKLNHHPPFFNQTKEQRKADTEFSNKLTTQTLRHLGLIIGFMCLVATATSIMSGHGDSTDFETKLYLLFPILLIALPVVFLVRVLVKR